MGTGTVTIQVDQAKIAELQAATPLIVKQAEAFEITTEDDYVASLTLREVCKARIDTIVAFFKESKDLAHKTHRAICKQETELTEPYTQADTLIAAKRQAYRVAAEAADRKREAEERAAALAKQQEELLSEAARLEKEGETEAAEVMMEHAQTAPAPVVVVESSVPKQTGAAVQKPWLYRIVKEDLIPREYMVVDESKLRRVVTALGDKANIPGIEVYRGDRESIRRR